MSRETCKLINRLIDNIVMWLIDRQTNFHMMFFFKLAPGQIEGSIPENSEVYGSRSSLRGKIFLFVHFTLGKMGLRFH